MSKQHTVQPLQQPFAQETGAAAIHIVRHSSISATVASAADGLFSAVTDLVFGHGFGRKRSCSASGATDAGSNGIMTTTAPADASGPLAQPAIKRHHTAPAPLSLTPTKAARPTIAAQPRHNLTSTAAGVGKVGTAPIVGVAAPAIPVHKQDQLTATTTGQRSLPVIRTKIAATTRSSDVITSPTTPEARAAEGLLELAATPLATTSARSSKAIAAGLCKVAAAPRRGGLPTAIDGLDIVGPVESSQAVATAGLPASITTRADLRPNSRIRVQVPCRYTKQDGTKSKSSWYHLFDATVGSIDVEVGSVSLGNVTVAIDSSGIDDPLVQAHCESIASRQQILRQKVGLVNRAGAWEPL